MIDRGAASRQQEGRKNDLRNMASLPPAGVSQSRCLAEVGLDFLVCGVFALPTVGRRVRAPRRKPRPRGDPQCGSRPVRRRNAATGERNPGPQHSLPKLEKTSPDRPHPPSSHGGDSRIEAATRPAPCPPWRVGRDVPGAARRGRETQPLHAFDWYDAAEGALPAHSLGLEFQFSDPPCLCVSVRE
jgi:hypothetical protein